EAPARFSTTIGWPSRSLSLVQMSRATRSTAAPAGSGTIMRIGLSGQLWADAIVLAPSARMSANAIRPMCNLRDRLLLIVACPPIMARRGEARYCPGRDASSRPSGDRNAVSRLPPVPRRAAPARRIARHQPADRAVRRRQGDEAELQAAGAGPRVQQDRH